MNIKQITEEIRLLCKALPVQESKFERIKESLCSTLIQIFDVFNGTLTSQIQSQDLNIDKLETDLHNSLKIGNSILGDILGACSYSLHLTNQPSKLTGILKILFHISSLLSLPYIIAEKAQAVVASNKDGHELKTNFQILKNLRTTADAEDQVRLLETALLTPNREHLDLLAFLCIILKSNVHEFTFKNKAYRILFAFWKAYPDLGFAIIENEVFLFQVVVFPSFVKRLSEDLAASTKEGSSCGGRKRKPSKPTEATSLPAKPQDILKARSFPENFSFKGMNKGRGRPSTQTKARLLASIVSRVGISSPSPASSPSPEAARGGSGVPFQGVLMKLDAKKELESKAKKDALKAIQLAKALSGTSEQVEGPPLKYFRNYLSFLLALLSRILEPLEGFCFRGEDLEGLRQQKARIQESISSSLEARQRFLNYSAEPGTSAEAVYFYLYIHMMQALSSVSFHSFLVAVLKHSEDRVVTFCCARILTLLVRRDPALQRVLEGAGAETDESLVRALIDKTFSGLDSDASSSPAQTREALNAAPSESDEYEASGDKPRENPLEYELRPGPARKSQTSMHPKHVTCAGLELLGTLCYKNQKNSMALFSNRFLSKLKALLVSSDRPSFVKAIEVLWAFLHPFQKLFKDGAKGGAEPGPKEEEAEPSEQEDIFVLLFLERANVFNLCSRKFAEKFSPKQASILLRTILYLVVLKIPINSDELLIRALGLTHFQEASREFFDGLPAESLSLRFCFFEILVVFLRAKSLRKREGVRRGVIISFLRAGLMSVVVKTLEEMYGRAGGVPGGAGTSKDMESSLKNIYMNRMVLVLDLISLIFDLEKSGVDMFCENRGIGLVLEIMEKEKDRKEVLVACLNLLSKLASTAEEKNRLAKVLEARFAKVVEMIV